MLKNFSLPSLNKSNRNSINQDTFRVAMKPKNITLTVEIHCFIALSRNQCYHSHKYRDRNLKFYQLNFKQSKDQLDALSPFFFPLFILAINTVIIFSSGIIVTIKNMTWILVSHLLEKFKKTS